MAILKLEDQKKENEEIQGTCNVFISTDRISVDTGEFTSRRERYDTLDQLMRDVVDSLNQVIPFPFSFEVGLQPRKKDTKLDRKYVAFIRMSIMIHPLRELIYFKLKALPIIGKYISGPKIVSNLFASQADVERRPNGS